MVLVLPIYEERTAASTTTPPSWWTPTARSLGEYRKEHMPQLDRFWEKFFFRPGNLGYPVFDTAVGKVGTFICYDRHFPEIWREPRSERRSTSSSTRRDRRGLSPTSCGELEQTARALQRTSYWVAWAINRVGVESKTAQRRAKFYGSSYFDEPQGRDRRAGE